MFNVLRYNSRECWAHWKEFAAAVQGRHTQRSSASRKGACDYERAFEQLYRESYPLVYSFVRSRMDDDASTEDVVAEAYMKAARSFGSFDPARAKFSTWVTAIAKNCMISYYRKQRPTSTLDEVERTHTVSGGQEQIDDRALILHLLAQLDESERDLIVRKYGEDMRNIDIARELGISPSSVSTKLARALAKMRKAIG